MSDRIDAAADALKPFLGNQPRDKAMRRDMVTVVLKAASAPDTITISRAALVGAMEAELKDYFFDGCSPTLGQHEVDHIIGCTLGRLATSNN